MVEQRTSKGRADRHTSGSAKDAPHRPLRPEDALSAAFHALADPSRRHILAILREAGELKIGDIAAVFEMSLNGVSKHVKVLEGAGLVERRIEGREHWLRVNASALEGPLHFLESHHTFWTARLDALASHMEKRPVKQPTRKKGKKQ